MPAWSTASPIEREARAVARAERRPRPLFRCSWPAQGIRTCPSRPRPRRAGMGVVVLFVIWVIAIALVYALSQSQAQSGALQGVVRVAGLRSVQWAGRSALNEAAFKLTLPAASGGPDRMQQLRRGETPPPLEPAATREVYATPIGRGEITIGDVQVRLAGAAPSPTSTAPVPIDMAVRVEYKLAGAKLSRLVRRRHIGKQFFVKMTLGPREGENIVTALSLQPGYAFEVMEP